jgi:radical SAM-linked protein
VRFTEGYNPRVRLAFPCASPTAMASSCEIVEIHVRAPAGGDEVAARLGAALPVDLPVLAAEAVPDGERLRLLEAAYAVRPRPGAEPGAAEAPLASLLDRDAVPASRRGKPVDLRPLLRGVRRAEDAVEIRIAFREDGGTARPEDFLAAAGADPAAFSCERTGMRVALRAAGGATTERGYGA